MLCVCVCTRSIFKCFVCVCGKEVCTDFEDVAYRVYICKNRNVIRFV